MTALSWLFAGLSLAGTWLNIKKRRVCFVIWGATNGFWTAYDLSIGAYAQAALFAVYLGLAVYGFISWGTTRDK